VVVAVGFCCGSRLGPLWYSMLRTWSSRIRGTTTQRSAVSQSFRPCQSQLYCTNRTVWLCMGGEALRVAWSVYFCQRAIPCSRDWTRSSCDSGALVADEDTQPVGFFLERAAPCCAAQMHEHGSCFSAGVVVHTVCSCTAAVKPSKESGTCHRM
jgi:hypothetical protein